MYQINNLKKNKLAQIAQSGEALFHTKDLGNLWGIRSPNNLYTTVKRYTKKGNLFRIYKGFYSIKPIEKINPFLIGAQALHKYCYLSAETVLSKTGMIQQNINYITFVSSQSKKFKIGENRFSSRKLQDKYLYQTAGIYNKDGINIATTSRAIADLLYFNPNFYFDAQNLINWKEVRKIQEQVGYSEKK